MLAVVGVALTLLALPGITRPVGRRLPPPEWAWLCALSLAGGLALLELALVLRSAPPVLRAMGVGWLASACERLLGPLLAGGPALSWAAGAAAGAMPAAAALAWRQGARMRRRLAAELWLAERRVIGGHTVVLLPVERPFAASFECGQHGQAIVVSDSLLSALEPAQAEAVVRHEAAHLRCGHQRLLTLATAAEMVLGWFPAVAGSAAELRLAVERWADEQAALPSPAARRAVRDSLVVLAGLASGPGLATFADARTVAARITALEAPPPRPPLGQHALLYLPGSVAGLVAMPALLAWGRHFHMVLMMSGRCPI